ncbi:hypothetical protein GCM10020219_095120 [Nonomuraea dietziae]
MGQLEAHGARVGGEVEPPRLLALGSHPVGPEHDPLGRDHRDLPLGHRPGRGGRKEVERGQLVLPDLAQQREGEADGGALARGRQHGREPGGGGQDGAALGLHRAELPVGEALDVVGEGALRAEDRGLRVGAVEHETMLDDDLQLSEALVDLALRDRGQVGVRRVGDPDLGDQLGRGARGVLLQPVGLQQGG